MFKGFIPGKRVASIDLNGVDMMAQGKENRPQIQVTTNTTIVSTPTIPPTRGFVTGKIEALESSDRKKMHRRTMTEQGQVRVLDSDPQSLAMKDAFDKLLDDLQIPSTLRPKLDGMEASVKAAMVRSSHTLALAPAPTKKKSKPTLRRTRSIDSTMESPRPKSALAMAYDFPTPPKTFGRPSVSGDLTPPLAPFMTNDSSSAPQSFSSSTSNTKRASLGIRSTSQLHLPIFGSQSDLSGSKASKEKPTGKDAKNLTKDLTPAKLCDILLNTSTLELDVEIVKKLRLFLRNESASWTESFIRQEGYIALLTRLNEILEVEWRTEQHDDQILHEFLRCFKALSTSKAGCYALRSSCPTPFVQLTSLLYSDKKPGDVATRQLIVDLLLILFDLYPPSALPSTSSRPNIRRRELWEQADETNNLRSNDNLITLPAPYKTLFGLVRSLLLTPAPPPAEPPSTNVSPHEFIESLHVPRIYKTYLQEVSDICRDYFWVFCHPSNTVWNLNDTDEARVEKPRAPGGMTGGVEFEAMAYLTSHFRFINAVSKAAAELNLPKEHELSAHRLHADLFASGIERILLVSRKASATYYPTLHLEIARYMAYTAQAKYEVPWALSRMIGPPPPNMCKPGKSAISKDHQGKANGHTNRSRSSSPTKKSTKGAVGTGPKLPMPHKVEPIKL